MRAFTSLAQQGLTNDLLAIRFDFKPGATAFAGDTRTYQPWLKEIVRQSVSIGSCLEVAGHSRRTAWPQLDQGLSQQRAEFVRQKMIETSPDFANRSSAIGYGSQKQLVGTGKNNDSDALDQRVEFRKTSCLTSREANVMQRTLRVLGFASLLLVATAAAEPVARLQIDQGVHHGAIRALAGDRSGRYLLTASEDKTARLWLAASGEIQATFRPPAGDGNTGKLFAAAMTPDGTLFAVAGWSAGNDIYLVDRQRNEIVHRISGLPNIVTQLAFSPGGRTLAVGLWGAWTMRTMLLSGMPPNLGQISRFLTMIRSILLWLPIWAGNRIKKEPSSP